MFVLLLFLLIAIASGAFRLLAFGARHNDRGEAESYLDWGNPRIERS